MFHQIRIRRIVLIGISMMLLVSMIVHALMKPLHQVKGAATEEAIPGIVKQDTAEIQTTPFVHPGGLFKKSDLERMKYMVQAEIEPWISSFNELSANSYSSYDYVVQGDPSWTVVERGGVNSSAFESDVTAAYLNALMWAITEDTRHADKAIEIFNTWSNLTEVTGGGTESLNAGLYAWKLVEAAEIIQSTYNGWDPDDLQKFKDMLVYPGYSNTSVPESVNTHNGTFYWRIYNGDPARHGNQDMIAWRAMITMAVFLDNRIMYDRALRYFMGLPHRSDDLPYASGPSPSGSQLDDNPYFTTYSYAGSQGTISDYGYNGVLEHYIWENGQTQESSRDQQHTFFGLGIAAGIAEVAWNQGDDVWNALDNRLLKGFEFTARYNTSFIASYPDQPEPWEPDNFIQRTDRTGRWFSKQINPYFGNDYTRLSRGEFPEYRPIFEQAVAHFDVRMGLGDEAIWTQRARDTAIDQVGYEKNGWSLDHPGWGALTFRRPAQLAGDPISGFTNDGVPVFDLPALPGTIEAEHYDYFPINGEGRTYHDLTSGNTGGQYRNDDVDIRSDDSDGYALTNLDNGEWLTYSVFVPTDGEYEIKVEYTANSSNGTIRFAFGGTDVTGNVVLPETDDGNWEEYIVDSHVSLDAGVQAMRIYIEGASDAYELNRITIENAFE